jgi:hypothetical protein
MFGDQVCKDKVVFCCLLNLAKLVFLSIFMQKMSSV